MREAKGLLGLGMYDGAYYLVSHTHNLWELVKLAGLEDSHRQHARTDPEFDKNWDKVEQWSEHSRYRRHSQQMAEDLVEAVCARRHGIIAWVKHYW